MGSYAINGSGLTANNGNYTFVQAAGNATALTITAATLTYTANTASRTYGASNPAFSGSVTGFVNGDTQSSATTGTLTFTSPASSTSNVGSYAINGSGLTANNGNYTFVQAAGNATALTITAATLTYTANTASRTYGASNPAFSGTVTGFVNGDTQASATTGTLTFTSPATSTSNVGSYAINGSGLTANNGNYTFVQAAGNATALTITAVTLTYTANTASRAYGSANPAFSGSVTGFVNGDTQASATTGTLTFTSPATTGSSVGSYAIDGSGLTANNGNYTFVQAAGNATALTITAVTLTYTANTASRAYGSANPAFSGSVTGFVNGDTQASATTGTLTFTSPATTGSSVGSYAIDGSGLTANNGNYTFVQAAGNATALTITAAPASVTPNAATKVYGTADPTFTGTLSGFLSGDGVTATYSRAPAGQSVASYTISATLNATGLLSNYNITYNTAQFTITPASLSITASNGSMTYGGTVPTITASYTGFVNGDTSASLTTQPTCSTTATSSSAVGSYPSSCTGAVDANYTISYVAGSVTVGKASLTIIASSPSMTYGGTVPAITRELRGLCEWGHVGQPDDASRLARRQRPAAARWVRTPAAARERWTRTTRSAMWPGA